MTWSTGTVLSALQQRSRKDAVGTWPLTQQMGGGGGGGSGTGDTAYTSHTSHNSVRPHQRRSTGSDSLEDAVLGWEDHTLAPLALHELLQLLQAKRVRQGGQPSSPCSGPCSATASLGLALVLE